MPDDGADAGADVLRLPVAELIAAYRDGSLSPVAVTRTALARIAELDPQLHAFVEVTGELALEQAQDAARRYRDGDRAPLLGVPVSVKDTFHVRGVRTTLGSQLYRDHVAKDDSGVVRRLRAAGAVFPGKTNTAEFGQSATTDNLLLPDTRNPWDTARTPGGSSGGAAASVAAGLCSLAVGSDGGGSIRIPAAFTGLFGLKPTPGVCMDERGFRAMSDFVSPGPMTSRVADARTMLAVLADRDHPRAPVPPGLRVAYCPRPDGRPVDPAVVAAVDRVALVLAAAGHAVEPTELPLAGWDEIFGPLVLEDEHRERGHLLAHGADQLTRYERSSLRAARDLDPLLVATARAELPRYRRRIAALFDRYDVLLTPATAVPAFELDHRPRTIDGRPVDQLWGAFPFAVPFNVAGNAAASIPCGLVDGLPVGAQLAVGAHREGLLLDVCEELEEALAFDRSELVRRWAPPAVVPT